MKQVLLTRDEAEGIVDLLLMSQSLRFDVLQTVNRIGRIFGMRNFTLEDAGRRSVGTDRMNRLEDGHEPD